MKFLCALAMLIASAGACMAEPAGCDSWFFFDRGPLVASLGRIVAPGPVNFLFDEEGCPSDAMKCVDPTYVIHGDIVILGPKSGTWQCAGFPNSSGGGQGWVPVAAVQPLPFDKAPPPTAWVGKWTMDWDGYVDIKREGANLLVDGHTVRHRVPWNRAPDYRLRGKARPEGNTLVIERDPGQKYGAAATLTLVGPYLIVQEHVEPNDTFVGFNGEYRRR